MPVSSPSAAHGNSAQLSGVYPCSVEARKEQTMRDQAGRKVETSVEARAGFLDRPVLIVLCVSLALAAVVFGALGFGFFAPTAGARPFLLPRLSRHFGRGRQVRFGYDQRGDLAHFHGPVLPRPLEESVERIRGEIMHWNHQRRLERL